LVYKHDPDVQVENFAFVGYVDSDHGPDLVDRKSEHKHLWIEKNYKPTMGWFFTQNDVAISWRSRKSPLGTDSSSASEFVAASDASKQAVYLRRLYTDFGYPQYEPTMIHEDNESCETLIRNYCGQDRIKHLDICASVVREHYAKGLTDTCHLPGRFQLADGLTKVNPGPLQKEMRNWMMQGNVPQDALDCGHLHRVTVLTRKNG